MRFDGACSPNPGPMGIGYTLGIEGDSNEEPRVLVKVGSPVGKGTNNEAEYHALIAGMRHALRLGFWVMEAWSDSLMVVNQMQGTWKVRGKLKALHAEAENLRRLFARFALYYNPREQNKVADYLSHQLIFEEPALPVIPERAGSRFPKQLQEWQAAAIRIWWERHHPGAGTLSRIFGIAPSAMEQIAKGESYLTADFSDYPAWVEQATGSQAAGDFASGDFVFLHPDRQTLPAPSPLSE